jgi:hypothetical protein
MSMKATLELCKLLLIDLLEVLTLLLLKKGQDALVLEMDYFAVAFLRDFALQTPAQTADADQRFMVAEYTLESRNEAASGAVYDLTTS